LSLGREILLFIRSSIFTSALRLLAQPTTPEKPFAVGPD
jgi:hypothetical protein